LIGLASSTTVRVRNQCPVEAAAVGLQGCFSKLARVRPAA
jgi:hypothetical protein